MALQTIIPNLCIFCYKNISLDNHHPQNSANVNQFCRTVSRLLGSPQSKPNQTYLTLTSDFTSCGDCEAITTQVCDAYHQMKYLELVLFWKLETLGKVMKSADKVPSRVTFIKECFQKKNNETYSNVGTYSRDIETFRSFRSEIKRQFTYTNKLTRHQPRILLTRLDQTTQKSINEVSSSQIETCRINNIKDDAVTQQFNNDGNPLDFSESSFKNQPKTEKNADQYSDEDEHDFEDNYSDSCEFSSLSKNTPLIEEKLEISNSPEPLQETKYYQTALLDDEHDKTEDNDMNNKIYNFRKRFKDGDNLRKTDKFCSSSETSDAEDNDYQNLNANLNVAFVPRKIINCAKPITTESTLVKDQTVENSEKLELPEDKTEILLICQQCGKSFKTKSGLRKHKETHKNPDEWKHECSNCKKKFPNQKYLRRHMANHSKEKPWKCDHCEKSFKLKEFLNKHLKYHQDEEDCKYQCLTCGKKYAYSKDLQNHIPVHSNERPWICEQCGSGFKWERDLKKHVEKHKKPEDWKHECSFCKKKCPNKEYLRKHMLNHSEEKYWQCDKCEKRFNKKDLLIRHLEYHKDPKEWRFQCSVCGRKYACSKDLKNHMPLHSNERPWICKQCGKGFKWSKSLQRHSKIHKGPF